MKSEFDRLAEDLAKLSKRVDKHAKHLEGAALASAASALRRAMSTMDKRLTDFVKGEGPGMRELSEMLASPQARKHLKLDPFRELHRKVVGKAAQGATVATIRKEFLTAVAEKERGEQAVAALQAFFRNAALPADTGEPSESEWRRLFLELGALDEPELTAEVNRRFKKEKELRAFAAANAVRSGPEMGRARIVREIARFARRAHVNLG